jgi:isopentenyldiphosphate isomerase
MYSFDHIITFGKYKGMSLGQILELEYSYILWLNVNNVLKLDSDLVHAAREYECEDEQPEYHDLYG